MNSLGLLFSYGHYRMYFTYIIYSESYNIYYIGQTNNLQDRLVRHNENRNKFTKNKGPWKLVFSKLFGSRAEAVRLEKKLKSFKNQDVLKAWIKTNSGSEHPV